MNTVFYLKVNRDIDYTYACTKYWLDVAQESNALSYIICDNGIVQEKLISMFNLNDRNDVVFIKSLTKAVEHISFEVADDDKWRRASDAHLTTFWHANANNIPSFWNIDADDTSFCTPPNVLSEALQRVELYANDNSIKIMGLDMWCTLCKGNEWTFGITYTDMRHLDWLDIIQKYAKDEGYKEADIEVRNIDSFFNYLRYRYQLPIESFYIKNVDFIHWGAPLGPLHYKYRDGAFYFPSYLVFSKKLSAGKHEISKEVIALDLGIQENANRKYTSRKYLKQYSSLYGIWPSVYLLKTRGGKAILNIIKRKLRLSH